VVGKKIRLFVGVGSAAGAAEFERPKFNAFIDEKAARSLGPIEAFMA
jgi:hypothetical protein